MGLSSGMLRRNNILTWDPIKPEYKFAQKVSRANLCLGSRVTRDPKHEFAQEIAISILYTWLGCVRLPLQVHKNQPHPNHPEPPHPARFPYRKIMLPHTLPRLHCIATSCANPICLYTAP